MTTIAFDVMGNDNGVKDAVKASMNFIAKNQDYKIILVGSKIQINKHLKPMNRIEVLNCPKIVNVKKGAMVIRDKTNSMYKAIELVKNEEADVVLSSGSSSAYIAYATLMLKRLKGVSRPAFMPIFPSVIKGKRFVMMDVGATLKVDGDLLYNWAKLGNIFSKEVIGTQKPRVAILNIGEEESKGFEFHKDAYGLLKKDKRINFIGFVEPRELLLFPADVIVTDGYAGNVCLKTMEGTGRAISTTLSKSMKKNPIRMIGALLSKGGFKHLKSTLDFRNVGGAWVMGVDGIVIKTHGSSDAKAFSGSFDLIKEAIRTDAINKIRKVVE